MCNIIIFYPLHKRPMKILKFFLRHQFCFAYFLTYKSLHFFIIKNSVTVIKIQCKRAVCFSSTLFATQTTFHLIVQCAPFLYRHVQTTLLVVWGLFWHWAMQKKFSLSENIIVVHASFTHIPPTSIRKYKQLADRGQLVDSNNMSCISYTIQPGLSDTLSTHFEPLYGLKFMQQLLYITPFSE